MTVGAAGCAEVPPILGSTSSPDDAETLGGFLYEPGSVDDVERYDVEFVAPRTMEQAGDELDDVLETFESRHGDLHHLTDVDFEETRGLLSFRTTAVLWADYDRAAVAEELDERVGNDFEAEEEIDGYTLYEDDSETWAIALGDGILASSRPTESEDDAIEVLGTVLETEVRGDGDREGDAVASYVTADDSFGTLLEALAGADAFRCGLHEPTETTDGELGRFAGEVGRGVGATLEEDAVALEYVLVFEDADAVPIDAVRTWTDEGSIDGHGDASVTASERAATVSATVPLAEFSLTVPRGGGDIYAYVPEPAALVGDQHYAVLGAAPGEIASAEGLDQYISDVLIQEIAGPFVGETGLEPAELERTASFGPAMVATGEFTADAVASALADDGSPRETAYEGYDIYALDDRVTLLAVGDGALVAGTDTYRSSGLDAIETVIDTGRGEVERYVGMSEDFALATEYVGEADYQSVETQEEAQRTNPASGEFAGVVASGSSLDFEGSTTHHTEVRVFDSASQADPDAVEEYVRYSSYTSVNEITVQQEGRVVVVTGRTPTEDLL